MKLSVHQIESASLSSASLSLSWCDLLTLPIADLAPTNSPVDPANGHAYTPDGESRWRCFRSTLSSFHDLTFRLVASADMQSAPDRNIAPSFAVATTKKATIHLSAGRSIGRNGQLPEVTARQDRVRQAFVKTAQVPHSQIMPINWGTVRTWILEKFTKILTAYTTASDTSSKHKGGGGSKEWYEPTALMGSQLVCLSTPILARLTIMARLMERIYYGILSKSTSPPRSDGPKS